MEYITKTETIKEYNEQGHIVREIVTETREPVNPKWPDYLQRLNYIQRVVDFTPMCQTGDYIAPAVTTISSGDGFFTISGGVING